MGTNHIITHYETILNIPGKSFNGSDERVYTNQTAVLASFPRCRDFVSPCFADLILWESHKNWKIATCLGMEQKSLGPFHLFFLYSLFFCQPKKSRHPTRKILGGNLSAHLPSSLRHGPCDVSPARWRNRTVRAYRCVGMRRLLAYTTWHLMSVLTIVTIEAVSGWKWRLIGLWGVDA